MLENGFIGLLNHYAISFMIKSLNVFGLIEDIRN